MLSRYCPILLPNYVTQPNTDLITLEADNVPKTHREEYVVIGEKTIDTKNNSRREKISRLVVG